MNNILITSIGRRVSLAKFFKNELKSIFPNAKVYGSDMNPKLSAACRVADGSFTMPKASDNNYITLLIEKCTNLGISLIIPTIDPSLLPLSQHKELLKRME